MNSEKLEKLIYEKVDQFKNLETTALELSWHLRISPSVITNLRNNKTDIQNMRINTLLKIVEYLDETEKQ